VAISHSKPISETKPPEASLKTTLQNASPPDKPLEAGREEALISQLASEFLSRRDSASLPSGITEKLAAEKPVSESPVPQPESMYRALVEQIPAVIFIAYLDKGVSEAYVSPQIESALGFTQEEWLDDPIRWFQRIHPEDKTRWSIEAAETLATGNPLKSAYRVLARDGRVLWFRCEAKMVRHQDGRPWFILGVGFDITDLKRTEEVLQQRTEALRNLSANLLQLQDQERRRIARDLHDGIGQSLVALKLNFDVLADSLPPRHNADDLWAESQRILEQCIAETRNLSYLLHPPMLEDAGLATTIEWYIQGFRQRSGLGVTLNLPTSMPRPPAPIEIAIYRVLQESLTNVLRHSGSKVVEISLTRNETNIALEVRDRGRGLSPDVLKRFRETGTRVGVGLSGMRERVGELGGQFEINSGHEGTSIKVSMPLGDRETNKG
jgi:PAS domain S-box-containing protein